MSDLKPWTTRDMIDNASNWTLAGDVRLLGYLEAFSEELLAKAETTKDNVNKLMTNLASTSLSLDIAKKEFLSLHTTQFVESRVYDDDYEDSAATQLEQSVEDKATDEDKVDWKDTIMKSVEIVNNYFDKVEVPGSDSEDETDFPSYILRPKDRYADRRLPYIIGTDDWHKKWHVGLLDTSSESEEEDIVEKFSDSDSDDLNMNNRLQDHQSMPDLHNITAKHPVANSTFEDMINNSDLFGSQDSEENNNSVPVQAPVSTNNFARELAKKLGHVIEQNPSIFDTEVNRKPIQTATVNRTIGNLFSDEPPPLEDDDLFGNTTEKGLFSGGSGLFDDIPKEDKSKEVDQIKDKVSVSKPKLPDLFSDDYDDFFNTAGKPAVANVTKSEPPQIKKTSNDLFDDVGFDDEDDLFKASTSNPYKKSYIPSKSSNAIPFFANEPPELTATSKTETKPIERKPLGGVKVLGNDLFGEHNIPILKPTNLPSKTGLDRKEPTTNQNIPKPSDMFDNIQSDDKKSQDVSEAIQNKSQTLQQNIKKDSLTTPPEPNRKSIDLFDDEDDLFGDDLFSNISTKKFASDLFSDANLGNLFAQDNKKSFLEDLGFLSPRKTHVEQPGGSSKHENKDEMLDGDVSVNKVSSENEIVKNDTPKEHPSTDKLSNSNNGSKSTGRALNVDLFDQNPPDLFDDGWDSKSDNLFDDNENLFDSTSVVTGQRSGLFDDEPPSLFSESSGIVRDMSCTRVETDDSFNPFASSSRRFSNDIFSEQQSNDSFFITKNKSVLEHRTQSSLNRIPEVTAHSESYSNLDITPSGNFESLFSGLADLSHQNSSGDDVFVKEPTDIKPNFDLFLNSTENTHKTEIISGEPETKSSFVETAPDETKKGEQDLLESTELISQIDVKTEDKPFVTHNTTEKTPEKHSEDVIEKEAPPDDFAVKIGSPGKLKHKLNINVNALRPSSGIINKKDTNRSNSVEVEEECTDDNIRAGNVSNLTTSADVPKHTDDKIISETESQVLSNITKDRAKIPVKRRPPSRKARQEAIRNSIADFRINISEDHRPLEKSLSQDLEQGSTPPTDIKLPEQKPKSTITILPFTEKDFEIPHTKSFASSSLFDDPEEFDDLFSSKKLPPKGNILKQALFDDDNDDNIFGNSSVSSVKTKTASTSKAEIKKLPKTAHITKLENKTVADDPLSFFQE